MEPARPPIIGPSLALDFSLMSFVIVDDQPFARRIIRSMLSGFGSREVYECANGVEGFDMVRTVMPSIIIADLVMPIFDGLQFVGMVKAPDSPAKKIPIIVLSGYLTKTAALAVTEHGADALLVKPVSPKSLHSHISSIVRARPAMALRYSHRARFEPRHGRSNHGAPV